MNLSNAELDYYDEIARCVYDALDYFERERGAIPPEIADRIWNMVDPSNYGKIQRATVFIENLFDHICDMVDRKLGGYNSAVSPDDLYSIVGGWVENKAARMIRDEGWVQRSTGEWEKRRRSFVESRNDGRYIEGRRRNSGIGTSRYDTMSPRSRGSLVGRRGRTSSSGDWASAMSDEESKTTPYREKATMDDYASKPPTINRNARTDRDAVKAVDRRRAMPEENTYVDKPPQRKPVKFSNTSANRSDVEKYNETAKDHALKVTDIINSKGSDDTEITVFDLQFTLPADGKTVASFAQTFLSNESSFFARIRYNDVKAFKIPEKIYNKARDLFKEAVSDLENSSSPGIILDSVIYDNFTRNEGKLIEALFLEELNKRIATSLFNRFDKNNLVPSLEEVKDVDEFINYKPYLELLGEEAYRWKVFVTYIVKNVISNLFTNTKRLERNTDKYSMLVTAESNNKFIFEGLDMQNAVICNNEERKNRYLDEYFKNFIVLEMSGFVFYTDILETAPKLNSIISQGDSSSIYEDAVFAGFEASNKDTGNDGFNLKESMSHSDVSLFVKRPDMVCAYDVKFPTVPTPNKILQRNSKLDTGIVQEGTEDFSTKTGNDSTLFAGLGMDDE